MYIIIQFKCCKGTKWFERYHSRNMQLISLNKLLFFKDIFGTKSKKRPFILISMCKWVCLCMLDSLLAAKRTSGSWGLSVTPPEHRISKSHTVSLSLSLFALNTKATCSIALHLPQSLILSTSLWLKSILQCLCLL